MDSVFGRPGDGLALGDQKPKQGPLRHPAGTGPDALKKARDPNVEQRQALLTRLPTPTGAQSHLRASTLSAVSSSGFALRSHGSDKEHRGLRKSQGASPAWEGSEPTGRLVSEGEGTSRVSVVTAASHVPTISVAVTGHRRGHGQAHTVLSSFLTRARGSAVMSEPNIKASDGPD